MEQLEDRRLLSTIAGQVYNDLNGNGLFDASEPGLSGATVALYSFNTVTGQAAPEPTATVTTDSSGHYEFDNVTSGTYQVTEEVPTGQVQTFPTSEHTAQSYIVDVQANQNIGTSSSPVSSPSSDWLQQLSSGDYSFLMSGDFLFQFGPQGVAPSRVFFSGASVVHTTAADTSNGVVVGATMTELVLQGIVQSDQHEQGYQGPITMTLSLPSSGEIAARQDNPALADSSFDINAQITIPSSFGVPTVLHTAVPINFLAREIGQFPAYGSSYAHRGTTAPISLLDASGNEQGQLFFGSLNPTPGLDFGNFKLGTIQGRAYIDANGSGTFDSGDTPVVGQPITLQQVVEASGSTGGDEGQGDPNDNGQGAPPEGKGESPPPPITVYTDANGEYSFPNLGPGTYTVTEPVAAPWGQTVPGNADQSYTIAPLMSSDVPLTMDFVNTFTENMQNVGTAPGYPSAAHTIVPGLHLGATEYANAPDQQSINDGVTFNNTLTPGATVDVTVNVAAPAGGAYLSGWIDYTGSKNWNAAGDQIFQAVHVNPGVNHLTFTVPAGLSLGADGLTTYARFRLSSSPNLGPDGAAADGEVEDYKVTIYNASQLGTIRGQTFVDTNGNGLHDPKEPGQDGWNIQLVDMSTGQVVATQTSSTRTITLNGQPVPEDGLYEFDNVVPGNYELLSTPPTTGAIVTSPASDEGPLTYRFNVGAGQTIGQFPSDTVQASSNWLTQLGSQPANDSLFTLGTFMMITGAGGGHAGGGEGDTGSGGSGSGGDAGTGGETGGSHVIRISVVGQTVIHRDEIANGVISAQITELQLQGIAVDEGEEGAPSKVLGPVTVTLGLFPSTGTIGPGTGDATGQTAAEFSLYLSIDASALGLGTLENTRPIVADGTVLQVPEIGMALQRSGGGSPVPMRDTTTGSEGSGVRLVSASLMPMFGVDFSDFVPATLSGTVYNDANLNNTIDSTDPVIPGATITVQQVVTEEGSHDTGSEGNGGSGGSGSGSGGSGGGETTAPLVLVTRTNDKGYWSLSDIGPGTYTITETPPAGFGMSTGQTVTYTRTVQSGDTLTQLDFLNDQLNVAPTITAPTAPTIQEDSLLQFVAGTATDLSIADQDTGSLPVAVTLTSTHGTMTLSETSGLTFTAGSGTNDASMSFTGSIADINAALNGLKYVPDQFYAGNASVTINVNDQGHTGGGGAQSASQTVAISVEAVANPPTLSVANAAGDEGAIIPLSIDAALTDTSGGESLSVQVTGVPAGTWLSAGTDAGGGTWNLTPAQLAGLTLNSVNPGVYTLHVTATATAGANGKTATESHDLTLTVNNVGPTLTAPGNQITVPWYTASFGMGVLQDPGFADGPWTVSVNWGDQTTTNYQVNSPGSLGYMPHVYATSGNFQVTVTAHDRLGGVGTSQFTITSGSAASIPVSAAYEEILHRAPTPAEASSWTRQLEGGLAPQQLVFSLMSSPEYYTQEIDQVFTTYLNRPANPEAVTIFQGWLQHGRTTDDIARALSTSPEFNAAHPTTTSFLDQLFESALGRAPNPEAVSIFSSWLNAGASRANVVDAVLSSPEYRSREVELAYQAILNRPSDPSGQVFFQGLLQSGQGTIRDVYLDLALSDENLIKLGFKH